MEGLTAIEFFVPRHLSVFASEETPTLAGMNSQE
jgi:hypothetical protein